MRIAIGGDSAGEGLARLLTQHLSTFGRHVVVDMSHPEDERAELYSELSERVSLAVLSGEFDRGILCCGTGIGVCISANKIPGIRAALTHDTYSAERAALSNNAHIITMGARDRAGSGEVYRGSLAGLHLRSQKCIGTQYCRN